MYQSARTSKNSFKQKLRIWASAWPNWLSFCLCTGIHMGATLCSGCSTFDPASCLWLWSTKGEGSCPWIPAPLWETQKLFLDPASCLLVSSQAIEGWLTLSRVDNHQMQLSYSDNENQHHSFGEKQILYFFFRKIYNLNVVTFLC